MHHALQMVLLLNGRSSAWAFGPADDGANVLKIGSIELEIPAVQAPLSGYSDLAMRRTARMHGAVLTFDEVVLDQLVLRPGKHQRQILSPAPDDHPIGGQLMGAEPDGLARAADVMADRGYDWIDVNLACPVRKVLSRHRGGYLLTQPDKAVEIAREVRRAVAGRCPVTVKLRRGWDETPESERRFFAILAGAFEAGIDAAIVHPRTVTQRYVGRSDWDFLRRVKQHVGDWPILGSGDLFTAHEVMRMLAQTGVDGVTLARGCIGNPWLFGDCRALLSGRPLPPLPSVPEQGETIARHLAWCVECHGERRGSRIMRKFGIKYSALHPHADQVRRAMVALHNLDEWKDILQVWYDPGKSWPTPTRSSAATNRIAAGAVLDDG